MGVEKFTYLVAWQEAHKLGFNIENEQTHADNVGKLLNGLIASTERREKHFEKL